MKLSRINTLLVLAIIALNAFIIGMPFWPMLDFWWQSRSGVAQKELAQVIAAAPEAPSAAPAQTSHEMRNRLVIPSMLLDTSFYEGDDARVLNKGPWLRPGTSTPDQGSNTVIAGHRFTYSNPQSDFYHLDKIKVDDEIGLFWRGKKYIYTVQEIKVASSHAVQEEAPTELPRLTLYTCTPLWLPKDRLVVIATVKEMP